jgi:protocatechuate 3,4-dioxygenase, alpha subunit
VIGLTPSQTVGPFLHIGLSWPEGENVVPDGTPGAIVITGCLYDGNGDAVIDGLIETWQADANGRFTHPDDPRGTADPEPAGFRGLGRSSTSDDGQYRIVTVKPGTLPAPGGQVEAPRIDVSVFARGGQVEAPHIDVSVFARGLLDRVVTRIYFPDELAANAADPVLSTITDDRLRATLVAVPDADEAAVLRFDIHLQGEHETAFFDV